MAYIVLADLIADMPQSTIAEALQDGDNPITFEQLATTASEQVDAILVQRVDVPISPSNPGFIIAKQAARIFALETLYGRRGFHDEQNPFTGKAKIQTKKLESIISKETAFTPGAKNKRPSASAITEAAKSNSSRLSS